jgi:hypothetical protein
MLFIEKILKKQLKHFKKEIENDFILNNLLPILVIALTILVIALIYQLAHSTKNIY